MVTVDLITGFLGAGKTTFIHRYLHYLQSKGLKVRMIENEFGDVSVDSQLLKEEDCQIDDLAGLCMCCVGKDAFIKLLRDSAVTGCDRIIVEPSGIYDVDEFFEVLSLPQIAEVCEIGSILTVADPKGMDYLTEEASYLLFAQLLASGMVLMSKTQMLTDEELQEAKRQLDQIMIDRGCEAGLMADLCLKPWNQLDEDDFEEFMDAGYARFVHDRELFTHSDFFRSTALFAHAKNLEDLKCRLESAFTSPSCGRIYRIKGFLQLDDGSWTEVNCTPETCSINPCAPQEEVMVVIGQQLRDKELKEILSKR